MNDITLKTLSEQSLERVRDSMEFTEDLQKILDVGGGKIKSLTNLPRFQLTSILEYGSFALARRMQRVKYTDENDVERIAWIPSNDREVTVFAGSMLQNYLPEGAIVTCVATEIGWMTIGEGFYCQSPTRDTVVQKNAADSENSDGADDPSLKPYSVFEVHGLGSGDQNRNAPALAYPLINGEGEFVALWDRMFAVTTGEVVETVEENVEDNPRSVSMLQCTLPHAFPFLARYEHFDGKDSKGEDIPERLTDFIGTSSSPSSGELWAPGNKGALTRAFVALPLYWWEWLGPDWVVRKRTVWEDNPDYDPTSTLCCPWVHETSGICVSQDHAFAVGNDSYDPASVTCQSRIEVEKEFWGFSADCAGSTFISDIETSEDPPTRFNMFWVAPHGFWASRNVTGGYHQGGGYYYVGGYYYGWRGSWLAYANYWRNDDGFWVNGAGDGVYWGQAGGWYYWKQLFGDRPPTNTELNSFLPQDDDVPNEDDGCGDLYRRDRYGWIVWEWGWPVLGRSNSHDSDDKLCVVKSSQFQFRASLVVENPEVPASIGE